MNFLSNFDLSSFFIQLLIMAPAMLLALSVHESSHAYVAHKLGDPTAQRLGRITLNPLKHLDPIGTLAIFLIHIGWGKPVPVNPQYFYNPQRDMALVSVAGPGSNILLALISALVFHLWLALSLNMDPSTFIIITYMIYYSVWVNLGLALFNLLPVPPLDGSKILMAFLPPQMAARYAQFEMYGFIVVLILFISGFLSKILIPGIHFLAYTLTGYSLL